MKQEQLLKKAQKGSDDAFIELLQEEKIKLYKMAFIYVQNEADALDIVQETVARAYANIHSVKEARYFSTWLMRVCINTALETLRKQPQLTTLTELPEPLIYDSAIDERLDLLQAIHQLEDKYKTVILLRYYRDLQTNDIAALLDCPEGTVKTNLHRAVKQLKKHFLQGGMTYGEQY